jgi:hypothetical protein
MKARLPGGREVMYYAEKWKVDDLRYDNKNPRIADKWILLGEDQVMTEEQIDEALEGDTTKKLYRAIVDSLGITEPLQIRPNGIVFEGNTRLWVIREIKKDLENNPDSFTSLEREELTQLIDAVPVHKYPDITSEERDSLLLEYHVAGKNDWPAFNQASHIYKLSREGKLTNDDIATRMRKSKSYVSQKLRAYQWFNEHRTVYPDDDIKNFSFYEEAYKIRKRLADNGLDLNTEEGMKIFQDMVHNESIARAIDVRELPNTLANPEFKEEIMQGNAGEALQRYREFDPAAFSPRFKSMQRLQIQLGKASVADMRQVKENKHFQDFVLGLAQELEQFVEDAKGWKT